MKKKGVKQLVLELSEGLLSTTTDILLFQFFLLSSSIGKSPSHHGASQMVNEALDSLEDINYKTLKRSFLHLKKKGLVRILKEFEITDYGRKRLKEVLPTYQKDRPWDQVIYLITYDILEEKRIYRDQLRKILIKLGAGYLQGSVWLTPYNPQKILKEFSQSSDFEGEIIVSRIGKDGYIGEESLEELISRVYKLEELNEEYQNFINEASTNKSPSDKEHKWNTAVSYLCILQRDPQLPWELLPEDWKGDKAYKRYSEIISTPNTPKKFAKRKAEE